MGSKDVLWVGSEVLLEGFSVHVVVLEGSFVAFLVGSDVLLDGSTRKAQK